MATYASARLDGVLVCNTLQAGVLQGTSSPVVCFTVAAGVQNHPVWAIDRLAFVIYAYCQASKSTSVEVSLEGTLVSNGSISVVVANHVVWHTSSKLRKSAERLIVEMVRRGKVSRTWWPRESMSLPVSYLAEITPGPESRNGS